MKKSEIFDAILDKVCEVCDIEKELVLDGSRFQTVVEARCLAVQYMRRAGLSNDEIALIVLKWEMKDSRYKPSVPDLKKKAKAIDTMFKSYSDRCIQSYAFRLMSKEISDWCLMRYKEEMEL